MIDVKKRTYNGVYLPPIEFKIVELFVANSGELITREDVIRAVWGENHNRKSKVFDLHLCMIKKRIPDIAIKCRPKFGYIYEP